MIVHIKYIVSVWKQSMISYIYDCATKLKNNILQTDKILGA